MSEAITRYDFEICSWDGWQSVQPYVAEAPSREGLYVKHADHIRIVAEREAAARKAALEEACKAMCGWCRDDAPLAEREKGDDVGHASKRGVWHPCLAGDIRSLMPQPGAAG